MSSFPLCRSVALCWYRLVFNGSVVFTVKVTPLLGTPLTVTTTLPVVAPVGTVATIRLELQLTIAVAKVPLKVTVLAPWDEPKKDPLIETCDPTEPEVGERLLIVAEVPGTTKLTPLLGTPLTVTTTYPVVAPAGTGTLIEVAVQVVGVAAVPLKVTVLVPRVAPKFFPLIVITVPTAPDVGVR